MKERPILFSGPMVRAILAGTKTQTRRVVTHEWTHGFEKKRKFVRASDAKDDFVAFSEPYTSIGGEPVWFYSWGNCRWLRCPHGMPGQKLWVRETWAYERDGTGCPDDTGILYRATDPGWDDEETGLRWRPSIFMPRSASRILLEITDVRVERLQEISEADARSEGITDGGCLNCGNSEPCGCPDPSPDARDAFAWLWQSINGSHSWHANPWVWVVSFKRLQP
jgi:hypothetical protein